ncbi:VOC family protein [Sinomicrobium kalidii]|uniref:VOC family protein n=1 Tax=Sinomicrobium kalidii TaxID=2900738 RepID=UPI001E3ED2BE|nr:VOC family protein [Sinomicrobium kalidii]UGU17274.1 VOC family protein [Sinomicrobium kalidii]
MENNIAIRRIVPNIYSDDVEKSRQFYAEFLGMELVMDMGWILTFASAENPTAQLSVFENNKKEPLNNSSIFFSIEVSDVDKLYESAKEQSWEIVYPITNEPWGVRRFFVKDPNGATVNLLTHLNE